MSQLQFLLLSLLPCLHCVRAEVQPDSLDLDKAVTGTETAGRKLADSCPAMPSSLADIMGKVNSKQEGVIVVGIPNMRCTIAGENKARDCGNGKYESYEMEDVGDSWNNYDATTSKEWKYMQCNYPTEEGGMVMHSYVFVDGEFVGDGFDFANSSCDSWGMSVGMKNQQL